MPRWPYRFEALLKTSSPLRTVIETCNERVFPVRTGKALKPIRTQIVLLTAGQHNLK